MPNNYNEKRLKFIIDVLYYFIVVLLVYLIFKYTLSWIMPFLIGFIVAAIISPIVRLLYNKLKIPKGLSSGILVLAFFGLITSVLYRLVNRIIFELKNLYDELPNITAKITSAIEHFLSLLDDIVNGMPDELYDVVINALNETLNSLPGIVYNFIVYAGGGLTSIAISLPNVLVFIIVTIVSSILISNDYNNIKAFIYMQIPERIRGIIFEAREHLVLTIFRMLRAYLIIIVVTFCELSIGFLIMGLEYAITLAFIISIVDILPILGVGTVLIPWSIFSFINGNIKLGISLLLLYAIITGIRQIIEPKIVGNQIGLNPLITLISIYVGLKIFGVIGMFIVPITVIILSRLQDSGYFKLWTPLQRKKKYR